MFSSPVALKKHVGEKKWSDLIKHSVRLADHSLLSYSLEVSKPGLHKPCTDSRQVGHLDFTRGNPLGDRRTSLLVPAELPHRLAPILPAVPTRCAGHRWNGMGRVPGRTKVKVSPFCVFPYFGIFSHKYRSPHPCFTVPVSAIGLP